MAINVSTPSSSSNIAPPQAQEDSGGAQKLDQDKENQKAASAGDKKAKAQAQANASRAEAQEVKDAAGLKANTLAPNAKINAAVQQLQTLGAHRGPVPLAEFAALAQDATRPLAQAAQVLSTHIKELDGQTPSVFTLLDEGEWKDVMTQLSPDAPVDAPLTKKPWAELVHRAVLKTEEGTFESLRSRMTPAMQNLAQQMAATMKPTFVAYVANATFQFRAGAVTAKPSAPKDKLVKAAATEGTFALNALPPVEVPSPALVAVEKLAKEAISLEGGDIAELAQIVMMECAREAEFDLRDLLKQMQETNKKRKQMREFIAAQKKLSAKATADLREQYDERCGIPKGDKARIDAEITSFDDFKESQKLVRFGNIDHDNDGLPSGDSTLGVSPNITYYQQKLDEHKTGSGAKIEQRVVDLADKLSVSPQKMQDLVDYWDARKSELLIVDETSSGVNRFHSFEEWLIEMPAAGGVGLDPEETRNQDSRVDTYLIRKAPTYVAEVLQSDYGLNAEDAKKIAAVWDGESDAFQLSYGGDFKNWMLEEPPFGPGMPPSTTKRSSGLVASFLSAWQAQSVSSSMIDLYDVSPEEANAAAIWARKTGESVEALFSAAGCEVGAIDNSARLRAQFAKLADKHQSEEFRSNPDAQKYLSDLDNLAVWEAAPPSAKDALQLYASHNAEVARGISGNIMAMVHAADFETTMVDKRKAFVVEIERYGSVLPNKEVIAAAAAIYVREMYQLGMTRGHLIKDGPIHDDHVAAARAALTLLRSALPKDSPMAAIAQNYVSMHLKLIRAEYEWLGKFTATTAYPDHPWTAPLNPAESRVAGEYHRIEAAVLTVGISEIAAQNVRHSLYTEAALVTSNLLGQTDTDGWWFGADTEPVDFPANAIEPGGLTSKPEPTAPEFTPSAELQKQIDVAHEAIVACDKLADAPKLKKDDFKPANKSSGDHFEGLVSWLQKPVDHSLKQPGHIDVTGRELTLAEVEAEIEGWQATYDSLGDMSQEQAMKLQIYQGRYSKFYEILSNMMKSISDLNKSLVGNLK